MTLASSKNLFLGIEREQWREMDLPPPPKEFIWEHNDSGKFAGLFEVSKN